MTITVHGLLRQASQSLQQASDTPWLDACVLLARASGISREQLLASYPDSVTPAAHEAFTGLLEHRRRGVPIAYLLGFKEFYGLEFTVNRAVLIPRPDSELVVEIALRLLAEFPRAPHSPHSPRSPRLHDCCTGSGCIAIAIAHELPEAEVSASDISEAALRAARKNADRLIAGRLRLFRSDLLAAVPGRFEVITANPPYLTEFEIEKLASGEPREALLGGPDGLDPYRRLIPEAVDKITMNGYLVLEGGHDQHHNIGALMTSAGFTSITHYRDLGGNLRVTVGRMER